MRLETAPTENACRDQEIAPTGNACRDLEIAGISIALAIHSFDPTKDAISDSAQYNRRLMVVGFPGLREKETEF